MDSPDTDRKKTHISGFLRCSCALIFTLSLFISASSMLVLFSMLIGNFSISEPISIPSQCKILSSRVDLKSSKICELGFLNYKAKNVFYPSERKKFRCRYDYYWASIFELIKSESIWRFAPVYPFVARQICFGGGQTTTYYNSLLPLITLSLEKTGLTQKMPVNQGRLLRKLLQMRWMDMERTTSSADNDNNDSDVFVSHRAVLATLEPGKWIHIETISYYISYLKRTISSKALARSILLDCYTYSKWKDTRVRGTVLRQWSSWWT